MVVNEIYSRFGDFTKVMNFLMSQSKKLFILLVAFGLIAASCGSSDSTADGADESSEDSSETNDDSSEDSSEAIEEVTEINLGAIPDQDPEILARNYELLATYLSDELGVTVNFEPVTAYEAAVSQFRVGDLDLVWFGGLTGVQARLQVEGADAIAQRDIDAEFTSVFIASTDSGVEPISDVAGLSAVSGKSLTFGSESSTSGRLMPQSFLDQAGVSLDDIEGEPGFSGAHDKTIELVEAGTYEVGALNSQVWKSRVEAGEVDLEKVQLVFETPTYYDYHWVARPELGDDLQQQIVDALAKLDPSDPDQATILEFFGAESFIATDNANYSDIESVGRQSGLIEE